MSAPNSAAVAVYENHERADQAVRALHKAGFDMKKLSIVGKDFHTEEHAVGFYTASDGMKFWGKLGAFWGGLWGLFFSSALLVIPVVGHVIVLGPLVAALVGALEGAVLGGSGGVFVGALTSLGIPRDSVVKYENDVKAGKFLVLAQGTHQEVERAREILGATVATQFAVPGT
jgi:hypothetical protein